MQHYLTIHILYKIFFPSRHVMYAYSQVKYFDILKASLKKVKPSSHEVSREDIKYIEKNDAEIHKKLSKSGWID